MCVWMCAESVEGLNLKEIRQGRKNRFYSPVIISMNSKGKPDFKNENLNVIKKNIFTVEIDGSRTVFVDFSNDTVQIIGSQFIV